jgi:GNAT superfamily N-acetyltransferase
VLQRILHADDPAFADVLAIYVESMPPEERKPMHLVRRTPTREDYRVFAWIMEGEGVAGFSMIYRPWDEPFALLEYMAVRHDLRDRGIGRALYAEGLALVRGEHPTNLLIEVDSERDATAKDNAHRVMRKRFYHALGARQVQGLNYLLPLWRDWTPPVMDLLVDPDPKTDVIDRSALSAWIDAVFQGAYGRDPGDPQIARMLATVSDPARLI